MYLLLFAVFVQLLLPPLWIVILYLWLDARWSGWKQLAGLYRAPRVPEGAQFEKATFYLNARGYRGTGTVVVNSSGIYVRLIPTFFILHPPLMIPWRSMKAHQLESGTEFEVAAALAVRLRLTEPALREAIRQIGCLLPHNGHRMPHLLAV